MKVVYIAGPLKGTHAFEVAENVREAERLGIVVAQAGAYPFIPHANTKNFFGVKPEDFFYAATLEMLRRCDAIALTKLWRSSKGAVGEETLAREIASRTHGNFPIFDFSDLPVGPVYARLNAWAQS